MNPSCQSCHQPLTSEQPGLPTDAAQVQCRHCGTPNALPAQNPEMSEFSGSTTVLRIQPQGVAPQPPSRVAEVTAHFAAEKAKDAAHKTWYVVSPSGREGPLTAIDILARHRAKALHDDSLLLGPDDVVAKPLRELLPQLTQSPSQWHATTEAAFHAVGETHEDRAQAEAIQGGATEAASAEEGDFSASHTMAMRVPSALNTSPPIPTQALDGRLFDMGEASTKSEPKAPVVPPSMAAKVPTQAPKMPSPRATVLGQSEAPKTRGQRTGVIVMAAGGIAVAAGIFAWLKLHG